MSLSSNGGQTSFWGGVGITAQREVPTDNAHSNSLVENSYKIEATTFGI
jgi:hypothetical protein